MPSATDIHQLVTTSREQYLWKQETRIRESARTAKDDPAISRHLTAVESAEDFVDYHEAVISHFRKHDQTHRIPPHERYLANARQIKLHHLDQLAHLLI